MHPPISVQRCADQARTAPQRGDRSLWLPRQTIQRQFVPVGSDSIPNENNVLPALDGRERLYVVCCPAKEEKRKEKGK